MSRKNTPITTPKGIPNLPQGGGDTLTRHVAKKLSRVFPTSKVEEILSPKLSQDTQSTFNVRIPKPSMPRVVLNDDLEGVNLGSVDLDIEQLIMPTSETN